MIPNLHSQSSGGEQPEPRAKINAYSEMLEFISKAGGEVRYDVFANEHLHGRHGFYSTQVDLRSNGFGSWDVPTPTINNSDYRHCLASVILAGLNNSLKRTGEKEPVIVEIGGGSGELKREICEQAQNNGMVLNYISIEPNPNHREAQMKDGTTVLDGRAEKIPLQDSSANLIFDEEVLDCFPMRVLSWDQKHGKFTGELFVRRNGDKLESCFKPPDPSDYQLGHCAADLSDLQYNRKYYCYIPGYWDYLKESARVLKPGGVRLSSDYGFVSADPILDRLFPDNLSHINRALEHPYNVDLTHWVDFSFLAKLALVQRQFVNCDVRDLSELFSPYSESAAITALARYLFIGIKR